jgi:hypothetical protein
MYVRRLTQLYNILFLLFATRFGLGGPSSGRYLQKLKMLVHILRPCDRAS